MSDLPEKSSRTYYIPIAGTIIDESNGATGEREDSTFTFTKLLLIDAIDNFGMWKHQPRRQLILPSRALSSQSTRWYVTRSVSLSCKVRTLPFMCPDLHCDESAYHYKLESLIFRNETLIAFARQSDNNITAPYHDCNFWQLANICIDQLLPLAQS